MAVIVVRQSDPSLAALKLLLPCVERRENMYPVVDKKVPSCLACLTQFGFSSCNGHFGRKLSTTSSVPISSRR